MRTYRVQLANVDHPVQLEASANPEMEHDSELRMPVLVFKRDDEVVGRFLMTSVVGWWLA